MTRTFKLNHTIAENVNAKPKDVLSAKRYLYDMGYYEPPQWGMTEFPDHALIEAIRNFQRAYGLRVDGVIKPGGESEETIRKIHSQARTLQAMGRNGDTVLAHITPAEARMLKSKGGAGTTNPATGLLEFYDADKKQGSYIWRTVGDGKVRSAHAKRNGKTFSWDAPPEGGHPGEAYNCRCRAEEHDCYNEKARRNEISVKQSKVRFEISQLTMKINNKKLAIKTDEARIKDWEDRGFFGAVGGALSRTPNVFLKGVGIAAELVGAPSGLEILDIMEKLKKDKTALQGFKEKLRPLENELKNLEVEQKYAEEKLKQCQAGKKG